VNAPHLNSGKQGEALANEHCSAMFRGSRKNTAKLSSAWEDFHKDSQPSWLKGLVSNFPKTCGTKSEVKELKARLPMARGVDGDRASELTCLIQLNWTPFQVSRQWRMPNF
jgi:hypothetical protein